MNEIRVYVGTYTYGRSEGIYVYRMDPSSGSLEYVGKTAAENPAFLAINARGHHLYAVNSLPEYAGKPTGSVSAFSIGPEGGELTFLNKQPSGGADPCYVDVHKTGRYVLVANYAGGSVAVLPVLDDGRLGEPTDIVQHRGGSVNPERQAEPHPHCILLDPAGRYAFVPDLGLDRVVVYRLDLAHGKLEPNDPPSVEVKPGAGPRHLVFHPSRRYAYVINELDSTLAVFTYDEAAGLLTALETVPALPRDFKGISYCADLHVTPDGAFLYGSNRGDDSIVIYRIDGTTGRLTLVDHEPTRGKIPRNFAIDPTGTFVLAANQDTDSVVVFRIDRGTGKLAPTGHRAEVPTPVCVKTRHVSGDGVEASLNRRL